MVDIKFSWIWSKYDPYGKLDTERTRLKQYSIKEMHDFNIDQWNNGWKNRVQMSNYDYRICNDTIDPYQYWNNCIYIDIDYKYYKTELQRTDYEWQNEAMIIFKLVFAELTKKYQNNIYYGELSRSCKGLHFIFYFDCDKTEENFKYYTNVARQMILNCFTAAGYEDVIHYPKVFDNCSNSLNQMLYITKNNSIFNYACNGKTDLKDIVIQNSVNNETKQKIYINKKYNYDIEITRLPNNVMVEYISHRGDKSRWSLYESLSRLFSGNELIQEWDYCCKHIPQQNDHNLSFYINEPSKNKWNNLLTGDEYIDKDLLCRFGYHITFKSKNNKNNKNIYLLNTIWAKLS